MGLGLRVEVEGLGFRVEVLGFMVSQKRVEGVVGSGLCQLPSMLETGKNSIALQKWPATMRPPHVGFN